MPLVRWCGGAGSAVGSCRDLGSVFIGCRGSGPGVRAVAWSLGGRDDHTPIAGYRQLVPVGEPLSSDGERAALAGLLAGYSGLTREAYTLDLRQYTSWCVQHGVHLFTAKRADIECFGREREANSRARATIARRVARRAG